MAVSDGACVRAQRGRSRRRGVGRGTRLGRVGRGARTCTSVTAAGCTICSSLMMVAPSLEIVTPPLSSWISLSMPRGPRVVRTTSTTAWQALMFEMSCALPCEVSVPSLRSTICGCIIWDGCIPVGICCMAAGVCEAAFALGSTPTAQSRVFLVRAGPLPASRRRVKNWILPYVVVQVILPGCREPPPAKETTRSR